MTDLVIDYSWQHPNPATFRQHGIVGVMRYLSHSTGKDLSHDEAQALLAAGFWIGLNWETSTTRAFAGYGAGRTDAQLANLLADRLGAPRDVVIFYSVDTGSSYAQVADYFHGVESVGIRPFGVYGGLDLAPAAPWRWVANAASWSGFRTWADLARVARADPLTHLLQHVDRPFDLGGAYDLNEVIHPFPAWGRTLAPPTPPAPLPAPTTTEVGDVAALKNFFKVIRLDGQGDGHFDVPGVKRAQFVSAISDTNVPEAAGYNRVPRFGLAADPKNTSRLEIVVEDGKPNATYGVHVVYIDA